MKRLVFSFLLLISASMLMGKDPYYIVDGKHGVQKKDLPPEEQIVLRKDVPPEEAVFAYGKKASGGAVLIKTKNALQQAAAEDAMYQYNGRALEAKPNRASGGREVQRIEKTSKSYSPNFKVIGPIMLILIPLSFLLLIIKSISVMSEAKFYCKGLSFPKGGRFDAFSWLDVFVFIDVLAILILLLFLVGLQAGWPFIIVVCVLAILFSFSMVSRSKKYIEIDNNGFHAIDVRGWLLMPKYVEVALNWKQIACTKLLEEADGYASKFTIFFYGNPDMTELIETYSLHHLPVSEVVACMNDCYARYSGKSVFDAPLIKTP